LALPIEITVLGVCVFPLRSTADEELAHLFEVDLGRHVNRKKPLMGALKCAAKLHKSIEDRIAGRTILLEENTDCSVARFLNYFRKAQLASFVGLRGYHVFPGDAILIPGRAV